MQAPPRSDFTGVTCPFCGLLCDDLAVEARGGAVAVTANGCDLARRRFAQSNAEGAAPRIDGRDCTLDTAVERAARLLQAADQPVVTGLATDVEGARAAVRLAALTGAAIDHDNGPAMERNLSVLRHGGWYATTLTEARNRADLVLLMGTGVLERFPRLAERVLAPAPLHGQGASRACVGIGPSPPALDEARHVECAIEATGELAAALAARVRGVSLAARHIAGVRAELVDTLAAELGRARYTVVVWSAAEHDYPHGDLAIGAFVALVAALNERSRAAVLPLGGSDGDVTANQVCAWRSGFGLRTRFARAGPFYDGSLNDVGRMLADGEADCCVWVSSFREDAKPPACAAPVIALAHPASRMAVEPAVYVPVGVPGVDHAGLACRSDGVVTLPLSRLRESALPPAADVLGRICAALEPGGAAHTAPGSSGVC